MNHKILLVDDEKDIVDLIEEVLRRDGFQNIKRAYTGADAVELCKTFDPDVIVLDIMLPDLDGIEVCKKIRGFSFARFYFCLPKTMISTRSWGCPAAGMTISPSLSAPGKSYSGSRRSSAASNIRPPSIPLKRKRLLRAAFSWTEESCRILKSGKELSLTGREFLLLAYLMENADKILSKERLYEHVWGEYSSICDNTIMVHIRHIREKIEDIPSSPRQLVTIKGLGYKLKKRVD